MIDIDTLKFGEIDVKPNFNLCGAYILKHLKSGMYYVGSAKNFYDRITQHVKHLRYGCHDNSNLQQAYNDDPELQVFFIITKDRDSAFEEEQRLLDAYMSKGKLFNFGINARAPQKGRPLSTEAKEKIRRANIGKTHSIETRLKRSMALQGIIRSVITREKIRIAKTGKPLSDEHRFNIGLASKGRIATKETREKMSLVRKGRPRPEGASEKSRQTYLQKIEAGEVKGVRKVSVNGIIYPSIREASRKLGIHKSTMRQRVNSKNPMFSEYFEIN